MYFQFNLDGTCIQTQTRSSVDTNPLIICTYYFEGTNLHIIDTNVDSSLPPCPNPESIYQVKILSAEQIEFIRVEDTCTPRRVTTEQIHERRS